MTIDGNHLYLEFVRVLKKTRPKFFVVENVRGMMSAKNGWFLHAQIKGFLDSGYSVAHELLHAPDYGVPQSRQRVFFVGVRKDIARHFQYHFLPPTHGPGRSLPYVSQQQAIGDLPWWPMDEFLDKAFHGHYLTRNRKRPWTEPSYTIVANASHVPLHPAGEQMAFIEKDRWALQGDFNRRLSWRECARLQGFPDDMRPVGRLEDKYRIIGNAVPPAFGRALIAPIAGACGGG
jgi:DNA (cytosine-5)-methyltransferase 1